MTLDSSYTLGGLIDSTTTALLTVNEIGDSVEITISYDSSLSSDKEVLILSTDFIFDSIQSFIVAPNYKTWIVPFNGSAPIQIADINPGGATKCYQHYCPCESVGDCSNYCDPAAPIVVNGRWSSTCFQKYDGSCPNGCKNKTCLVSCGGKPISSTYVGSAYIIKANYLIINGISY